MKKAERYARLDMAIEVASEVYTDMCRDPDVPDKQLQEFCRLLIQMQCFNCSLYPRPYDHEE